jgi:biotin carboxyl carrier protein
MRRFAPLLLLLSLPSAALAAGSGGAAAPAETIPTGQAGGTQPGVGVAPVARLAASARDGVPHITLRVDEPGVRAVSARLVVLRSPGNDVVAAIPATTVRTGRRVEVPWKDGPLAAGRYLVRVHAKDRWGNQLSRPRGATGKAAFVVKAAPAPEPEPQPETPAPSGEGVHPVGGPFTYGDGLGADRGDHVHQGQDMAGAEGTPIRTPTSGTVVSTASQPGGAGFYVVVNADNGYAYFFAHCQKASFTVSEGQAVAAGTQVCRLGTTGASTGPHLHFEIWENGWRTSSKSRPIDPLPFLKSWE